MDRLDDDIGRRLREAVEQIEPRTRLEEIQATELRWPRARGVMVVGIVAAFVAVAVIAIGSRSGNQVVRTAGNPAVTLQTPTERDAQVVIDCLHDRGVDASTMTSTDDYGNQVITVRAIGKDARAAFAACTAPHDRPSDLPAAVEAQLYERSVRRITGCLEAAGFTVTTSGDPLGGGAVQFRVPPSQRTPEFQSRMSECARQSASIEQAERQRLLDASGHPAGTGTTRSTSPTSTYTGIPAGAARVRIRSRDAGDPATNTWSKLARAAYTVTSEDGTILEIGGLGYYGEAIIIGPATRWTITVRAPGVCDITFIVDARRTKEDEPIIFDCP